MSNCCFECFNALIGHKVIIHSCRCKYLAIVCEICPSYMKVIEVGNGSTKIINLDRIDYIEEVGC